MLLMLPICPAGARGPIGPRLALVRETWRRPHRVTLLTVGPDGNKPVRLAGGQENDGPVEPFGPLSWRADGSKVAFSGLLGVFLAEANGGGAFAINALGAEWPVFAPNGHTIAFTRDEETGASIWTIDLITWEQRQLTLSRSGLTYVASSFSPDGATLLATRLDKRRSGEAEPVAFDIETGRVTRLLPDGLQPVYSPDGSKIALFRKVGKRKLNDLFVLNAKTGGVRQLTHTSPGYELFASWDPSGQRIAFVRFPGRHFESTDSVVEINADGTCEAEIFSRRPRTIFYGPAWQPGPGREAGPIAC
jgi:Tol biopolymer transport system component